MREQPMVVSSAVQMAGSMVDSLAVVMVVMRVG
jgi:hypothetical protein